MKVIYRHERDGVSYGNILWSPSYPMRNGKFPSHHPCANNSKPSVGSPHRIKRPGEDVFTDVPGETTRGDTPLDIFRQRGYWASCFPEGDGITMKCERNQTEDQVKQDIRECFGWDVEQDKR